MTAMNFRCAISTVPVTLALVLPAAGCRNSTPPMDTAVPTPSIGDVDSGISAAPSVDAAAAIRADAAVATCGPFADGGTALANAEVAPSPLTSFFVSSDKSSTGNLGGLAAADGRCQKLAAAAGLGKKTWHAYLSVEHDASKGRMPRNARDRIGRGPWYNARGVLVAADLASLHSRKGDPTVFVDERGNMVNGRWTGSPMPSEHDILTGSNADGTVALGKTCLDWTSARPASDGGAPDSGELFVARVGHTDGFGPNCSTATSPNNIPSWNSAHDSTGCDNTAPRGGAGRIYCFATH